MSNFEFQDILNMQYPNPEIEKDFPDKILRAAQFAPFAALTGYDEAVIETACKWYNKVYRISPIKYTGFRHKVYKFSP